MIQLTEEQQVKWDYFVERTATSTDSMATICKEDEAPAVSSVLKWLQLDADDGPCRTTYRVAKESQADLLAESILEIADDGSNDWMERRRKDGSVETVLDHEHVQRSRLRIDSRKWLAAKLKPKSYGERQTLDLNHGVQDMTDDQLEAHTRQLASQLGITLPDVLIHRPADDDDA